MTQEIEVRIRWTCPICGRTKKCWSTIRGEAKRLVERVDFQVHVEKPEGWQEFKDGRIVCDMHIEDL